MLYNKELAINILMKEIKPTDIAGNIIELISHDWMLVTAGDIHDFNTMTASWGMMGEMWGCDVAECVIRPQRFTRQYVDRMKSYTLSFFPENMRKVLTVMGTKSGREIDKMHYPGLDAVELPSGLVTFKGARLVVECEVMYVDKFDEGAFLDKSILDRWYDNDLHYRYIGRITHVWIPDDEK